MNKTDHILLINATMDINLDKVKESIEVVRADLIKEGTGKLRLDWQDGTMLSRTWRSSKVKDCKAGTSLVTRGTEGKPVWLECNKGRQRLLEQRPDG